MIKGHKGGTKYFSERPRLTSMVQIKLPQTHQSSAIALTEEGVFNRLRLNMRDTPLIDGDRNGR